ncbi:MAG: signal peptide peptidase SppA [Spirochaetes bacterium]|nr:signal peptide peptidase SppA [Spirochaetota bacterium]
MDRNRRIIFSILILLVLSCLLAIIEIGINMQKAETTTAMFKISPPEFGPGVGVIRIYGGIEMSDGAENIFGLLSGSDAIVKQLDDMAADEKIKAIVVRINSPGGTVAATQELFAKLIEIRKKNVVLVASMGDLAASGGYYAASACNYIFANHGTITGSIGVKISGPNIKGLFDKLGIKMNVIKSGRYKDLLAEYRDMSPEEREIIQEMIDSSYNQFVKDVSLGRNIAMSEIMPYADGRIVDGDTAVKYKLVDGIGTYETAISKAKELAKLPPDCPVYDNEGNPMKQFFMSLEGMFKHKFGIEERLMHRKFSMIEYSIEP